MIDNAKVIIATIKKIFIVFINNMIAFPCIGCNERLSMNEFCPDCLNELVQIKPPFCPGCGGELDGALAVCSKCIEFEQRPWIKAFALFRLQGIVRNFLHRFKYSDQPELARAFGSAACEIINDSKIKFDIIVPIPLHWRRMLLRGYNQTALFGQIISQGTGIPCVELLYRKKHTLQQAKLNRKERIDNLKNAFTVKKGMNCSGLKILLLDDVFTTGATLSSAAKTLKVNNAGDIYVMVIGRR